MLSVDYIGSKSKLINQIDKAFTDLEITSTMKIGDLFAGSGVVSQYILNKYKANVITNDFMYYAYLINCGKLTKYTKDEITIINDKINEYNNLLPIDSFITKHFAPPKRKYFTKSNAMKIDAIRTKLDIDKQSMSKRIYHCILASLLSAADKVSNTSVVYSAYLKRFKNSALKPLTLLNIDKDNVVQKSAQVFNQDVFEVIENHKFDIVYLDPPYNNRQYEDNYHVLNTIAKYNDFDLHGKTGLSFNIQKSCFSSKTMVYECFKTLIDKINTKHFVISYNDEGLLSLKDIRRILALKTLKPVKVKKIKYKKFKAQEGVTRDYVIEYIIYV